MHQLANIINLTNLSWDVLILIVLFVSSFLYGLPLNKDRIVLVLFSTYIAFSFVIPLSYFENLVGKDNIFFARIAVFVMIVIFVFYLLSRSFVGHTLRFSQASGVSVEFLKKMSLALAQMGLFVSIFFDVILTEEKVSVATVTEFLFMNHTALIIWLAIPIVLLGIFKK